MISIRTISYNLPGHTNDSDYEVVRAAVSTWNCFDIKPRTQRLTLPVQKEVNEVYYQEIYAFCKSIGIRWFNIPFDPWAHENLDVIYEAVPRLIRNFDSAFCNIICTKSGQIREDILKLSAETIKNVADIIADGSANFRLGISMNIQPNGPFFPFTYSDGESLSFSVGLELAEEINQILLEEQKADLNALKDRIIDRLDSQICGIEAFALQTAEQLGIEFRGIDFSLAPLPQHGSSVITILEQLGIQNMNDTGIMFGTAFLTDILKYLAARHKSVGFSGVMYSLLEDYRYAEINDISGISIDRMISTSTMCGCGVDMVPVAFDVTGQQLRTILMEVGCISSRLHKPLGVRILPAMADKNGRTKIAGDGDFITNTKLVPVQNNELLPFLDVYSYYKHNM